MHICAVLSHSPLPTYTEKNKKNLLMKWITNKKQLLEVEKDSPHTQAALCERGNRCL